MEIALTVMYHKPVFLKESVDGLVWKPEGTYVDLTFGGGGHSAAILEQLKGGRLFAFDQDQDAAANAEGMNLTFIQANFRHVKRYLKLYGVSIVDGILADLGVSSHQFDVPDRGFSTRFEAELDMRMDQQSRRTAKEVVNTYSERELHQLLGMYGEVKNAKTLAQAIVAARTNKAIETVADLKQVLNKFAPKGREAKYYAQVFQALRLEVNDEIKALEEMLEQSVELLAPGGRLVVLSYHSLEDRLVKHMINKGKLYGEVEKDFYGNTQLPLKAVTKKPLIPSQEEIRENSRARSAKLRIAEKR
jgi:16S rRNA (cytosine1402-N4)-methyltransferase